MTNDIMTTKVTKDEEEEAKKSNVTCDNRVINVPKLPCQIWH